MKTENKRPAGNRTIAEFMGGKILSREPYEMPHGSRTEGLIERWIDINGLPSGAYEFATIGIFNYDTKIEWIWPVVEKIESLGFEVIISRRGIQIWRKPKKGRQEATDLIIDEDFLDDYTGSQKIISIWDCCVSFINWYNKQNQFKEDVTTD